MSLSMTEERKRSRAGKGPASDHDLTTRTALALDRTFAVGRIVVGQLLAFSDVAGRDNPDGVANHARIAIGFTCVVDVTRDVATNGRVANVQAIELETPDVTVLQV